MISALELTEILHDADFVAVDIVLAIQCVTSVGRNRKSSGELCRRFQEGGNDGHFARWQIDELKYGWRLERVHKVNPTLAQRPKPMAADRQRFPDQLFALVSEASIRQPRRKRHTPDSGRRYTPVVQIPSIRGFRRVIRSFARQLNRSATHSRHFPNL